MVKNKIYKYKTNFSDRDLAMSEWSKVKKYLERNGYEIEIEKITECFLGFGLIIHYYFVEKEE